MPTESGGKRAMVFIIVVLVFFAAMTVQALELWANPDTGQHVELNTTLKLTGLAAYTPNDNRLYPERRSASAMTRMRFDLDATLSEQISAEFAYEHRARRNTSAGVSTLGGSATTPFGRAPWRAAALDWRLADHEERLAWRHEIDRALISVRQDWGSIVVGRQAIGFGRGMLFSAVDVFAPFSPVEVDREWRRGVDALRVEYRTSPLTSLEVTAVFGDRWANSALLGRFRGYIGDIDGEVIVGKRGRDAMFAATMSTVVGGAATHGELAFFQTPEDQPDGGIFGKDDLVAKAVLGASYTLNVGNGLTLLSEYHYSGFGIKDPANAMRLFRDNDFVERYLRGDSQTLGRHTLAVQAAYPISNVLASSFLILESLTDGSGLASPGLMWTPTQTASITINAFMPWGARPRQGQLRSEYGASPWTLFTQLSLYF